VTSSLLFLGPTVTATVTGNQKVHIVASQSFGSTAGARLSEIYPAYRVAGSTGVATAIGSGIGGLTVAAGQQVAYTVTGIAQNLIAGDYEFGMAGFATGAEASKFDQGEDGYVTIIVLPQ
jgi:hypothetical protein